MEASNNSANSGIQMWRIKDYDVDDVCLTNHDLPFVLTAKKSITIDNNLEDLSIAEHLPNHGYIRFSVYYLE